MDSWEALVTYTVEFDFSGRAPISVPEIYLHQTPQFLPRGKAGSPPPPTPPKDPTHGLDTK